MRYKCWLLWLQTIYLSITLAIGVPQRNGESPRHELSGRAVSTISACSSDTISVPLSVRKCINILTGLEISILNIGLGINIVCTTTIETVDFDSPLCLCTAGGALTPTADALVKSTISANGTAVQRLTTPAPGVSAYTSESLYAYIAGNEPGIIAAAGTSCDYPTGSIPRDCGVCNYDCPAGTYLCGSACVDESRTCVSGIPLRRRDELGGSSDFRCPKGFTACAVPTSAHFRRTGYECLNIMEDVEACGGCAFPLPGGNRGKDCTSIRHAYDVTCQRGACVVHRCRRGWQINHDASGCIPDYGSASEGAGFDEHDLDEIDDLPGQKREEREETRRRIKAMLARRQVNPKTVRASRSR